MTVGEALRLEREKKGLSIKDVETATSIRALYISAIEEDNYKVVPGEVYLKGFIRNYANYLGLQAQQMVDLYRQSQNIAQDSELSGSGEAVQEQSANRLSSRVTKRWVVGIIIICLAGGVWWMSSGSNPHELAPIKESKVAPNVPEPPAPQIIPNASVIPPQEKPVVVIAKYTSECWTLVTADGKTIYEGIPKSGDAFTWEAQKDITIKVGNADGVDVVYNGQPMGKMGDKGEVVVKTFSAK